MVDDTDGHLGRFFLSVVGSAKRKTLHKGGECHRIPGVHYRHFVDCGADSPQRDSYDRLCKDCFPRGLAAGPDSSSDEADGSSSSSESDVV